uniref:Uncharacterized protein n=1 Tax=Solanum lycopersicum TaxID=4081 RepID=A0A3Q7JD05_SOLLC
MMLVDYLVLFIPALLTPHGMVSAWQTL